jgi:pimeloyl-ACP methyl ester carboxylesterase
MRDRALPPAFIARWRAALPQAKVVELESAGRWPQEEAPEAVVARVKGLLASPTKDAFSFGGLRDGTP